MVLAESADLGAAAAAVVTQPPTGFGFSATVTLNPARANFPASIASPHAALGLFSPMISAGLYPNDVSAHDRYQSLTS